MEQDKIWLQSYEDGIPPEINPDAYENLTKLIESFLENFQDRDAFHCMGRTITYSELDDLSKRFSVYLTKKLGLKKGDRVAIMLPNILQYPVALFGILRAGLVVVNVNPLYTARELKHQLNDSEAKAIIIFQNSAATLADILNETPLKYVLTTQIGDMLKFPKNHIVNFVIKNVKKMVPSWSIPQARSFVKELETVDAKDFIEASIYPEDSAFLQYTGGTTGVSKGAELTHKNIVANILQIQCWFKNLLQENAHEIVITPLPLYHIFSLTANCFYFSSLGGLNVLITNPRDLPGFVKELKKWKFTALTAVNTLFNGLLNTPGFEDLDFSSLKLSLGGGMAVQRPIAEKWQKSTNAPLLEAYGLSETSPAVCINPSNHREYNGAIGLPIPSTLVQICDDEGNPLPQGEEGELCVFGPQVMKGYWNRPEETSKVMTPNGFFRTGDIAIMDQKGFFKIVDRKKDMILVSGFNVYPNEIEETLCKHPKVFECAAVGVPDEKSGEAVKVFIVSKGDDADVEELRKFCKENLTGYKVPRFFEFRKELPKSNVGKILRKDLRIAS